MQWLNTGSKYETTLGPNLVHCYPNHKRQTSELSNNKPSKIENGWLYLSALSNWRFVNLNQSFRDALNLHPRPLVVTAKLTVNKQTVTQRLGQVHIAPDGLQRYCFTPPEEQFPSNSPTGKSALEELDGTLANFHFDIQCVVMLHFKQSKKRGSLSYLKSVTE